MRTLIELVKVARPGFWPTHLWFYLLPFSGRQMFGSVPFWVGCVFVCFPLGILLYGWNDLGDVETDRINPRKDSWLFGARPDARLRRQLPWIIALVQVPFLICFVWLSGTKMLGWFAIVLLTNASYNQMRFKSRPVLDLLNQAGYLSIFVLASWLCSVPQLNLPAMLFSALFAMQSHLFGQLMDVHEDGAAGRRSTAVALGIVPAKRLLVAIMLVESAIAFSCFRGWFVGWFMLAGAGFFLGDSLRGPERYPIRFLQAFFILWNCLVLGTMYFVWRYGIFLGT